LAAFDGCCVLFDALAGVTLGPGVIGNSDPGPALIPQRDAARSASMMGFPANSEALFVTPEFAGHPVAGFDDAGGWVAKLEPGGGQDGMASSGDRVPLAISGPGDCSGGAWNVPLEAGNEPHPEAGDEGDDDDPCGLAAVVRDIEFDAPFGQAFPVLSGGVSPGKAVGGGFIGHEFAGSGEPTGLAVELAPT
jgi:hypothetical protein